MKKNSICVLLALVMIMGLLMAAPMAFAAEESTAHSHCYCVNAEYVPEDHVCEENVTWENLSTATIADGGHYYLTKNTAKGVTVSDGKTITICLNGYNLYAGQPLVISPNCTVNLCNCQSAGRVYSTTRSKGSVVLVSSSSSGVGTLNLYSGNISGVANSSTHIRAVEVKGGQVNMYGGTIIDGRSDADSINDSKLGYGGNVYIYKNISNVGIFNMYGGTITGGKASADGGNIYVESGTLVISGGTITGGSAVNGGNIWTGGGVKPTITNAVIQNGEAQVNGGNIYAQGSTYVITNSTITGGIAGGNGGNIFAASTGAAGGFTINGGAVQNGNASYGGNIALLGKNMLNDAAKAVTLTVQGATISGGTATNDGGNVYVETSKLLLDSGTITGGSATNGGNIATNGNGGAATLTISGGSIENGVATGNGGNLYMYFTTNGTVFSLSGGMITGGKAVNGGNIAMAGASSVTTTGGTISDGEASEKGGNIYTHSVTKADESVSKPIFNLGGVTVSGGTAGKTVETVTNEETQEVTEVISYSGLGGSIYINTNGTLSISAGTVSGGQASSGGNIYTSGTLNITGGTITGGYSAATAGNIRVNGTGSTLNMTGGVVSNGEAVGNGGNIFVYNCSNASITGGQILDGRSGGAQGGGNLYVTHDLNTAGLIVTTRKLTLEKVKISGGKTTANGGNVYVNRVGVLVMNEVTLENGSAVSGDNLYLQNNLNVDITGGTFTAAYGGRNYVYDEAKHTNYTQEQIETYGLNYPGGDAEETGNGGNICIYSCGKNTTTDEATGETTVTAAGYVNITGAAIMGGNAENGGAIYVGNATVTLDGITAKTCGGDSGKILHIAKNGSATVKDSTLINWGIQGSTIVNSGSLTLQGNISMPKEYNANEMVAVGLSDTQEILIKCNENANAVVDISGLTSVDADVTNVEGIYWGDGVLTVGRYQNTNKDGDVLNTAGLVANGVNDTNRALIEAYNSAFVLVEREASFYLDNALIQGVTENGNLTGGGADFDAVTNDGKTSVVYYILNGDVENAGVIGKDIYLNLNGKHVSGATVAEGVTLYLMDTANDSYDAAKCGSFAGTVNGTLESIVHKSLYWNNSTQSRHYVILPNDDGSYSAHRFMARISDYSLDPANDALGYKANFRVDAVAQKAMTGYGFEMWVNDNAARTYTMTSFDENTTEKNLSLRLKNIMAADGGEMTINANAFISFDVNGQEAKADTTKQSTTMKNVVELAEAAVEADPNAYTETQMTALQSFIAKFEGKMTDWNMDSIKAWVVTGQ